MRVKASPQRGVAGSTFWHMLIPVCFLNTFIFINTYHFQAGEGYLCLYHCTTHLAYKET